MQRNIHCRKLRGSCTGYLFTRKGMISKMSDGYSHNANDGSLYSSFNFFFSFLSLSLLLSLAPDMTGKSKGESVKSM